MNPSACHCITICIVAAIAGCKQPYPHAAVITNADYKKGEALLGKKNDSAFYYFNQVATTSNDSLEVATSYNNMAVIQSDAGDYFGAQESLLISLQYLKEDRERDAYCLASDYNELGTASLNLKNYPIAIEYYSRAIRLVQYENYKSIFANNQALAFQKNKEYAKALAIYQRLLSTPGSDKKTIARIRTNLAVTRWEQDSNYNARPELWDALATRSRENDDWGLISSYRHLSDYYARPHPDSAMFYARGLYDLAKNLVSPEDEIEALQKMIVLGSVINIHTHFARYHFLNDSLQTARNNAKNQFALIRYEAEKNKADNLVLQTENAQKKYQILWQWVLLLAVGTAFAWGIWWYRKRQQQIKWAAEKAIREHALRTSQKVHDVVAGGLYRIMTEIEYRAELDKTQILDSIESLYERSRDISYEKPVYPNVPMDEWVAQLLLSYATDYRTVLIRGNEPVLWKGMTEHHRAELEKILSELMINMKKHSGAENIVIKFQRKNGRVHVEYTDDGKGIPQPFNYGNGLSSTENRITALGGAITFVATEPKGLGIRFYLPITTA